MSGLPERRAGHRRHPPTDYRSGAAAEQGASVDGAVSYASAYRDDPYAFAYALEIHEPAPSALEQINQSRAANFTNPVVASLEGGVRRRLTLLDRRIA
jgi:hypothetical protein